MEFLGRISFTFLHVLYLVPMKFKNTLLLILFLNLLSFNIIGQTSESDIENTKISILTCKSGDQLYSTFGHTAIRIFNPESNLDHVYNYGLFSFDTPNFYIKFMRGQLPYLLGATKMHYFLEEYQLDKRTVLEQDLILDNDQKQKIIKFLIENAKPENRAYKYDFFFDNCATRVVDVYELVGNVSYSNDIKKVTFRDLLKENLQNLVWSDFGIDLVIGARADKVTNRRDQMFLPQYVMENLASASKSSTQKLATSPRIILDFEELDAKRKGKSTNWPLILMSILLCVTLFLNFSSANYARYFNTTLLIISGILGLFLLFMWFGTDHGATRDNWNILWLNPLIFFYLFTNGQVEKIVKYILLLCLVIAALNCLYTFLPQFYNLGFLPIILSLIVILVKSNSDPKNLEISA